MRVLIVGAGAVGAYIGARLARSGEEVTLFARGPHLAAMRERGVKVLSAEGDFEAHPRVVSSLGEAGVHDVVILAVKAHALPALAAELPLVIGEGTTVVSTQNGIPWWYFQRGGAPLQGLVLSRVDPGGEVGRAIPPESCVGSIIYFATHVEEPGVIRHTEGERLALGEPDGSRSERCRRIAEALVKSGLRCAFTTRIRHEIWLKILGNVAFNPISALTGATLVQMADDPDTGALVRSIMLEVEAVASRLGIEMPVSLDKRIAGARNVGAHKTSMLQDLEAGRPLELEAVVGAVIEVGERLGVDMPCTRAVYACTKLLEKNAGLRRDPRPPTG